MGRAGQAHFHIAVPDLFLNTKYSNLKIYCGDKIFPAHKTIVCPQSDYFEKACTGEFQESNGKIVLDSETKDAILIEKMLEYLYKGYYDSRYVIRQDTATKSPLKEGNQVVPEATLAEASATNHTPSKSTLKRTAGDMQTGSKKQAKVSSHYDVQDQTNTAADHIGDPRPSLDGCHPSYYHLRMFAEADYFKISGLERLAAARFKESLSLPMGMDQFCHLLKELYSCEIPYKQLQEIFLKHFRVSPSQPKSQHHLMWEALQGDSDFLLELPDLLLHVCKAFFKCPGH
ncbi:hypothetical protein N7468_005840 [Penicillium chermesinum]|uniref:BTB domain-containing protein n=1 Tax=Penicillium chermesinum TaxID=63820 RepID=A0A9W9TQ35_9EURO|nr:uncharacterized protein N7468_005840 [Penicillium chermesinum]KAJ5232884.1 hypothetical protein N7468_005840 [Penicillium chermesinum]KAJ6172537.1 hypothetical protein N7470_001604 [Penicillium chermesinum]